MKFLLVTLLLFSPLFAAPQDEISVLEELIDTTKKNLEGQQALLKILFEFKEARDAFIQDPDSNRLATTLVKRAMRLQKQVEQEHLSHLFSADFLMELTFYNQIGKQVHLASER